jgi:adenine-specific DNA-methyltransferase
MPSLTLNWLNKAHSRQLAYEPNYPLLKRVSTHVPAGTAPELAATLPDSPAYRDNWLIHGDNLQALKALLPFYRGQVKCIFIDPPYNTGSAFEHYNDKLEHTQWLHMMYPRLILLRELLADDGSIWVTLDDNEAHYAKVLMDEVFGRQNFVANVVWQSKDTPGNNSIGVALTHNHVLVYAQNIANIAFKLQERNESQLATYQNPDKDPRGVWLATPLTRVEFRERDYYGISNKVGKEVFPPKGSSWRRPPEKMEELELENRIWWGTRGDSVFPMEKKFLTEVKSGVVNQTWWPYQLAGSTRNASAEQKALFNGEKTFDTPKPEKLLQHVFNIATNPNDLVLDSFLGSGTTAAVAHKMGRRYIGIEMGSHALTHCVPRLEKVIAGEQGGISAAVGWQGGGAFSTFTLGAQVFLPSGKIDPSVRFADLAAYVWQQETRLPATQSFTSPCLGVCKTQTANTPVNPQTDGDGSNLAVCATAYYLLYNGILGDKRPAGGNVLTYDVLTALATCFPFAAQDGQRVVFGEACKVSPTALARENMVFKKIPYSLRTGKMI